MRGVGESYSAGRSRDSSFPDGREGRGRASGAPRPRGGAAPRRPLAVASARHCARCTRVKGSEESYVADQTRTGTLHEFVSNPVDGWLGGDGNVDPFGCDVQGSQILCEQGERVGECEGCARRYEQGVEALCDVERGRVERNASHVTHDQLGNGVQLQCREDFPVDGIAEQDGENATAYRRTEDGAKLAD